MPRALLFLAFLASVASAAQAQTVSYFETKTYASGLAAGPDGNLWFPQGDSLGYMNSLGQLALVSTPHRPTGAITMGPDGQIWFARAGGIDSGPLHDGTFESHDAGVDPVSLAAGPDGNIWFGYAGGVGRMTPTGTTTLFPVVSQSGYPEYVYDMTSGPDGNIWFADYLSCGLRSITPAGQVASLSGYVGALRITSAHGALWITRLNLNSVTQVSPSGTTNGVYDGPYMDSGGVPTAAKARPSYPGALTAGADGRVWFGTENPVIGSVSPAGDLKFVALSNAPFGVTDLVAGADGNIWATTYPIAYNCVTPCPPPPATAPIGILRINLVNPAPRVTGFDNRNPRVMAIFGAGFVPDSVIQWNGVARTTIYVSPFEVRLSPEDSATAGARGGAFVVHNAAPGGGDSLPIILPSPRHRVVH
jgi:virginiamycin B lyase